MAGKKSLCKKNYMYIFMLIQRFVTDLRFRFVKQITTSFYRYRRTKIIFHLFMIKKNYRFRVNYRIFLAFLFFKVYNICM